MPTKNDVLEYLNAEKDRFLRQYGVECIGLFGSLARNDCHTSSDIDILVRFNKPTFDAYMDLKFEIEDHFGVPVDLVMQDCLKPRIRPAIERETVFI